MFNTYNTSLSGMLAASYGLQNSSHNMANMQSPGFKKSDVFYSSLGNGSYDNLGSGVTIGGNTINFSDGHYLPTSNPTDLAIIGQGFFIVKLKNGELCYTRDGEFIFNKEGILIDKHSHGQVQGYDSSGHLRTIHQSGPKFSPGKASKNIFMSGTFVAEKENKNEQSSVYKNIQFTVYKVFDEQGKEHEITLEFKSNFEPGIPNPSNDDYKKWNLENIICSDASIEFSKQDLIFGGYQQALEPDYCNINFSLNHQPVTLHFGNYRENDSAKTVKLLDGSDVTSVGERTKITTYEQDGYALGKQMSYSFDDNGQITYEYDNNQTIAGIHVGLARFEDLEHSLVQTHNNLFKAKSIKGRHIGKANTKGLGIIQPKQLESANVDSTTEFANIVVLQRMFQSCSQIMNIDKELLEGLYKK